MLLLGLWTFFAALVRGYAGFGFAMLLALGLLGRYPPAQAVPLTLLLDLLCSAPLWLAAARLAHPGILRRLLLGSLLALPVGGLALAWVPATPMALLVAAICLVGGVLVLRQKAEARRLDERLALPAGVAAGLATSLATAGGPPLMLYLLRSGLPADRLRATAILYFAFSSAGAVLALGLARAIPPEALSPALWLLWPALAGNFAGQWLHRRWRFPLQRAIGLLLVALSLWVLGSNLLRL